MQTNPFSLRDKSILITGGGSGIGLGQTLRFLQEGARVAVAELITGQTLVVDGGRLTGYRQEFLRRLAE